MARLLVTLLAATLAAVAPPARAADQLVLGKRFQVSDPTAGGNSSLRFVTPTGRELSSTATVVGDPIANGATLEIIANGTTPSDQSFVLPPGPLLYGGAGWKAIGKAPTIYDYYYKDRTGVNGPVKVVVIVKNSKGTFTLQAALDGRAGPGPQPHVTVVPPAVGTDGGMIFTIGGGDRYCTAFGGAAGGVVINLPGLSGQKTFKVLNATAKPGCPMLSGSTTTTVTSTTSTSTTIMHTFQDLGDGTILDVATGLQWEQKTTPVGSGVNAADLHDVDNKYAWAGCCGPCTGTNFCQPNAAAEAACKAQTASALWAGGGCNQCGVGTCNVDPYAYGAITTSWSWLSQVNATNFAGHGDWRLARSAGCCGFPTGEPAELEGIVDLSFGPPTIDPIFGPTASGFYWSGSTYAAYASGAWGVDFGTGSVTYVYKPFADYVRAVR